MTQKTPPRVCAPPKLTCVGSLLAALLTPATGWTEARSPSEDERRSQTRLLRTPELD